MDLLISSDAVSDNYYLWPLDILFDFVTKRVIKFVLHTNAPGHPNFGIYSRCNFAIAINDLRFEIQTHSKFDEFSAAFYDPNSDKGVRPVVLQRQEPHPFGSSFCYGIHQIVVEVMENGYIAALTLYDKNL
ncbi:unnamed protein product [Caenorhabditis bovis]|uniref:Uncharacterized protein n=1 Tax=Caenorhabditis bovis TaxID=2654633 RepID=A0A8S1EX07_9PELO|nr:unnamed protein product [Caenorhabditis bovis]